MRERNSPPSRLRKDYALKLEMRIRSTRKIERLDKEEVILFDNFGIGTLMLLKDIVTGENVWNVREKLRNERMK